MIPCSWAGLGIILAVRSLISNFSNIGNLIALSLSLFYWSFTLKLPIWTTAYDHNFRLVSISLNLKEISRPILVENLPLAHPGNGKRKRLRRYWIYLGIPWDAVNFTKLTFKTTSTMCGFGVHGIELLSCNITGFHEVSKLWSGVWLLTGGWRGQPHAQQGWRRRGSSHRGGEGIDLSFHWLN